MAISFQESYFNGKHNLTVPNPTSLSVKSQVETFAPSRKIMLPKYRNCSPTQFSASDAICVVSH